MNDSVEGRRMTVEIISRSISTKVWDRAGMELATPGSAVRLTSVARHVTDFATFNCVYMPVHLGATAWSVIMEFSDHTHLFCLFLVYYLFFNIVCELVDNLIHQSNIISEFHSQSCLLQTILHFLQNIQTGRPNQDLQNLLKNLDKQGSYRQVCVEFKDL